MFRDFLSYLKSVFTEGHSPIFTMFTILGITLFMFPQLADWLIQDKRMVRNIGVGIFLLSFISAHFFLYRKAAIASLPLLRMSEHLLLSLDKNLPNNAELRYSGEETLKDFKVWLIYTDKNGAEQRTRITDFYQNHDADMVRFASNDDVLCRNDGYRFHLIEKKKTYDGKVMITISFRGSKNKGSETIIRNFDLNN